MKKLIALLFVLAFFSGTSQTQMPIGPQTNNFTGMVRGYHFTAPVAFNLCALYIPPDAPGAAGQNQHIRVVRFTAATPPAFPGVTNAFVQLFTITNAAPNATVPCNITINAGDIIGIYGARAGNCINSYDGVAFATNIMGNPTVCRRSGMQACIAGGAPMANIWSEINYNIGRIFMYYNCCPTPTITTVASSTNICSGASVTILGGGATTYTWMPGNINTASIAVTPSATTNYTLSGSTAGCTGVGNVTVTVNATPTISSVSNTGPVCQGSPVTLSVNTTVAGVSTFTWTGPNAYNANTQNPVLPNTLPNQSGNYSVTVSNSFPGNLVCQATGATTLSVVPTASIAVTPNFTLCQGTALNLTANAAGASSYSWTGPGFNSAQQNPTINSVLPANAIAYNVTASFINATTTLICTSTASSNVQVVATFPTTVTATPNNLCQFTNANITASAPGAVGFSWVGPNNFTSNLAAVTINNIQPADAGTYFSTATFAIGTVSCSTSGSALINVVPVNPVIVTPTISVCEPANAQLSASSSGAATYSWTGPNNFSANYANPTLYFPTPTASGMYVVTTSYNNGQLTCYNSNTTQLIVNPRLTFTLDAYRQQCYNTLLNVNGPVGATSYSWTSSTGFSSNLQNLTIPSIQPGQAGTYTLNVSLGPCVTTQKIQVDVLTPLAFTLTPQSRTICRGDSIQLVAGSTGGSQNYAYVWNPGAFLTSPTGSIQYGHPAGTTVYNLAGYDIACPNYTVFHSFTVQVNQPPMPNLQLDKAQGCEPLCLFYNTKTQTDAAITTYDFGGANIMQGDSFYYCLTQPGTYNLKINSVGKNGCKGVYEFPVPIVVFPKPHSDFDWSPQVITTSNNQVTFNPMSKYGPITSLNWMFNGTGINGVDSTNVNNPQRVFETVGKYPIMLIQRTENGCIDTVIKIIDVADDMNVFIPNSFTPNGDGTNDIFNVKGLGFKLEGFSMELFDRWGHSLFFTKDVTKGWDGTVKGQPAQDGVYVYKIKAVGSNGEGKKEYIGHVTLMK